MEAHNEEFNLRTIKSSLNNISFKDFENIFEWIKIKGKKERFEEHYYNEIILVFEKLIRLDYDSIINKNNEFLIISDNQRKVWSVSERDCYYTRIYYDLCFAIFCLTNPSSVNKDFNPHIGFRYNSFEEELFPYLIDLMKNQIGNRNSCLIKCIIASIVNYMFTLHKDDLKIPLYYQKFSSKNTPIKTPFDFFLKLFDQFLFKIQSNINRLTPQYKEMEPVKRFTETFMNFKTDVEYSNEVTQLLQIISNFKVIIDDYDQTEIYYHKLMLEELKVFLDSVLGLEEKIRDYYSDQNYGKYISGGLDFIYETLDKPYDIWECLYSLENLVDIQNNEDELVNYFTDIVQDKYFEDLFYNVLKSQCIKSYYESCEIFYETDYEILIDQKYQEKFYKGINLVPLPPGVNGFTDCTLITFINNRTRKIKYNKTIKALKLFKYGALLITLLHESNHFLRRYMRKGFNAQDAKTNRNSYKSAVEDSYVDDSDIEGGEIMSKLIFNKNLTTLNIFQILYILDLENWDQDFKNFRKNFKVCEKRNFESYDFTKFNFKYNGSYEKDIIELIEDFKDKNDYTQIIYCDNSKEKQEKGIHLGQCLISICRKTNPDYTI